METLISENVTNADEPFSSSEIIELRQRLATLEQRVSELETNGMLSDSEAAELNASIEKAFNDLPVLKKKIWYRLSMNRILGTLKSIAASKEAREIMKEAVKKLIGLD